jgi:hypothetical protein
MREQNERSGSIVFSNWERATHKCLGERVGLFHELDAIGLGYLQCMNLTDPHLVFGRVNLAVSSWVSRPCKSGLERIELGVSLFASTAAMVGRVVWVHLI